ncbi:hypothetical protein BJ166DRAFT_296106 [Pestalotiopsis sp. NC0098]|nr:hypothetical protein BJ166DRAFT_296106 [Pestalotiopsis sp. NC0098]
MKTLPPFCCVLYTAFQMESAQSDVARTRRRPSAELAGQETRRKRQRGNTPITISSSEDSSDNPSDSCSDSGSDAPVVVPTIVPIAGKNAWTVFCETYPELELDPAVLPDERGALHSLAVLPARNRLVRDYMNPPKPFHPKYDYQSLWAVLVQITGTYYHNDARCHTTCKGFRGQWMGCVVAPAGSKPPMWEESCANCIYDNMGANCCLRQKSRCGPSALTSGNPAVTAAASTSATSTLAPKRTNRGNETLPIDDFDSSVRTAVRMSAEEQRDALKLYRKRMENAKLMVGVLEAITNGKER